MIENKPSFIAVGGDRGHAHVRAQLTGDGVEIVVSNGLSSMGHGLTEQEAQALAEWLLDWFGATVPPLVPRDFPPEWQAR